MFCNRRVLTKVNVPLACDVCSQGIPELDVINRWPAVCLAGWCGHVADSIRVTRVSRCREVVHNARHADEEQKEDEHHIKHEQRVQRHELHSPWGGSSSSAAVREVFALWQSCRTARGYWPSFGVHQSNSISASFCQLLSQVHGRWR